MSISLILKCNYIEWEYNKGVLKKKQTYFVLVIFNPGILVQRIPFLLMYNQMTVADLVQIVFDNQCVKT